VVKKNNNHLAEGEFTGHFHELRGDGVEVLSEAVDSQFAELVVIPKKGKVVHQEHKPIEITEDYVRKIGSEYIVLGVLEFDPLEQRIRRASD